MSKGKLKEIEKNAKFLEWEKGEIHAIVKTDDYDWLIERVQELESDLQGVKQTADVIDERCQELYRQNERYREAIESIERRLKIDINTVSKYHLHCILDRLYESVESDSE